MYIDRVEKIFGQKHRRGDLALVLQQNKVHVYDVRCVASSRKNMIFKWMNLLNLPERTPLSTNV